MPDLIGDEADLEEAWRYFIWLEATEWKHLPKAGGLEDQDEILMNNIFSILAFVRKMKSKTK